MFSHTEQRVKAKAYAAATEEYVSSSKVPTIGSHDLRHAELLESIDEDKGAYAPAGSGRSKPPLQAR